ncbi:MAG: DNA translocase FtsK [Oscillospiraceae bacterium]|jgi:S-DNA-T family DNA segregation ATPase FtsK/SpoIIIE|nr:DNA translocase FtsK [Oscillospiraceae bacterium]
MAEENQRSKSGTSNSGKSSAGGKNGNVSGGRKKRTGAAPAPPRPFGKRSGKLLEHGSVLAFAAGLVLFFLCIIPGQNAWFWLHNVYRGVFGIGAYGLVIICISSAIALSFKSVQQKAGSFGKYLFAVGTVLLTSWHVLWHKDFYFNTPWPQQLADAFNNVEILRSGGAFGAIFGALLGRLGIAPALVILGVSLLTLILLWTRQTVVSAVKNVGSGAKKVGHKVSGKVPVNARPIVKSTTAGRRKTQPSKAGTAALDEWSNSTPPPEPDANAGLSSHDKDVIRIFDPKRVPLQKAFIPQTPPPEPDPTSPDTDIVYRCPPLTLLKEITSDINSSRTNEQEQSTKRTLLETLASFGVHASIAEVSHGPSVTRYELVPEAGVRINRITNLADDIALRLAAVGVRIEAPIPGKSAIGIEVPNKHKAAVGLREILDSPVYHRSRSKLNVALGRDISGSVVCADLAKMPHLLIAGTTGSGKSVCMNTMIVSLLFNAKPGEVRLLMIDPKQVEFSVYNGVPHLEIPVVSDTRKAAGALAWAVGEMEKRYKLLSERGVRDVSGYNDLAARSGEFDPITRMVIFIDELADLMMVAPKEVEDSICRLAQKARAAGIHLVIATQRPSVDVITGLIKANIPSRIALSVSSQVDSRTILDMSGAEKLLGYGDMLFLPVDLQKPVRVQGCYISDAEVEQVVRFISMQEGAEYNDGVLDEIEKLSTELGKSKRGALDDLGSSAGSEHDEMFEEAVRVVVEAEMASTTLLQRRLKLGYARASRVIDELEQAGIVGPFEGSKPRKVLVSKAQYYERTALGGSIIPQADEPPPWDDD